MSDRLRGLALLLSVVLWLPAAPALLRGDRTAEEAALLYAGSLLLAHLGCAALAALLRAYAPEPEDDTPPTDGDAAPGSAEAQAQAARRATDAESARRAADAQSPRGA